MVDHVLVGRVAIFSEASSAFITLGRVIKLNMRQTYAFERR